MSESKHYHQWVPFIIISEYPIRRLCATCGKVEVVKNHNEVNRKVDKWVWYKDGEIIEEDGDKP